MNALSHAGLYGAQQTTPRLADRLIGGASLAEHSSIAKLEHTSIARAANALRVKAAWTIRPAATLTRVFGRATRAVARLGLKRAPLITMGLAAFGVGIMRGIYEGYDEPYAPPLQPNEYKPAHRGMSSNHLSTEGLTQALYKNRHR